MKNALDKITLLLQDSQQHNQSAHGEHKDIQNRFS